MTLKTGDVVLFRKVKTSFISKAISAFTGSSYAHVGIISSIDSNTVKVAEALAQGFTMSSYNTLEFSIRINNDELLIKRSKEPLYDIKKNILKYLGRPYGYLDLLLILISKLTGKRLFKGSATRLICSEAVAKVLYDSTNHQLDLAKEYDKPYSYVTPDDIFMSTSLKTIR